MIKYAGPKETKWQAIKWEIEWNWENYITSPINRFKTGIKNFWIWREVIWNDRWYDEEFFHVMLKKKLQLIEKGWNDAHYMGSERTQKEVTKLLLILEQIEYIGNHEFTIESEKKISLLYSEFGHLLFAQREHIRSGPTPAEDVVVTCALFELLWD